MTQPVTIIGGGLAGLTLGIGLRQRNVPVTIHEAGQYPRHRVCGEFISGRGQDVLERLKLHDLIQHAGAVPARTIAFYSATRSTAPRSLPAPAICLSRFALDEVLAKRFRELGGELHEHSRIEDFAEGVVRATGRRLPTGKTGARWFGLKLHARNVSLAADLEMHLSERGYVGLCKINDGEVNVCGLFQKHAAENHGPENWRDRLRGQSDSWLRQRFAHANIDESSVCAVAGLSLQPQPAAARFEICVGDAITMIPPITGNGMSMAFESAGLAIEPLVAWSRQQLSWSHARQQIAADCDSAFVRRLAWAKWLQRILLKQSLQNPFIMLAARSDWFWRLAFESTR
jgi:2-polyprenyl-6-methoxyphenol hydroxylase-like FAD-dependent oxidoreductase